MSAHTKSYYKIKKGLNSLFLYCRTGGNLGCRFSWTWPLRFIRSDSWRIFSDLACQNNLHPSCWVKITYQNFIVYIEYFYSFPSYRKVQFQAIGYVSEWFTFWSAFETAILNNDTLVSVDNFNYLRSFLIQNPLKNYWWNFLNTRLSYIYKKLFIRIYWNIRKWSSSR